MNKLLPIDTLPSVQRWADAWRAPNLPTTVQAEWSSRMSRSVGRCYPQRRLIRLSTCLREAEGSLFEEVLCHELAHVVARDLHGDAIRSHGKEWKALMRLAGFEPRTRLPADARPKRTVRGRRRHLYVHTCPRCQATRTAKRTVPNWRCVACIALGLSGMLRVTRRNR